MIKYQVYGGYPPGGIYNPYSGIGGYDINAGQPGEARYIQTDPQQSINILTGEEDEPTTGTTPPGASGTVVDLDPNKNAAGNWYEQFPDPDKEKANEIMRYAEDYTKNCPKGQKWDPVKQQCYKEKYVTGQPMANLMLAGLHGINRFMDRKNEFKDNLRATNASLADAQVPTKDYNGVDFYGYEDVNTFTPNPRYGTYNRSVYQPGAEYAKKGGPIKRFAAGGYNMDEPCPPGYIYDPIYGCIETYQKFDMKYTPEQINRFWEKMEKSGLGYDFYDNVPAIPEDDPFLMQIKQNYNQIHENRMRNSKWYRDDYEKNKDYYEQKAWPQEQREIYIDEKMKLFKKHNVSPDVWMDLIIDPKKVFPSGPAGPNQKYNMIPQQEYQMMQDEYEKRQNEYCPCTKDKPLSDGTMQKVCVPCEQTAMAPAPMGMAPAQMRFGGFPMNKKKGGDVQYLTKNQIEQILREGGEIEFLN